MGEAGIGKSAGLVEALRARLQGPAGCWSPLRWHRPPRGPSARSATWWAVCEQTARRAVTDGSDRDRVLAALHAELGWPEHPTVLVIEDVHWADDATATRCLAFAVRQLATCPPS